jgi:membrane-associated phospholipid phosphatase
MVVELRPRFAPDRRGLLAWSLVWLACVVLCWAFVDRPFATFSHDVLHRPAWCVWLTWLAVPPDKLAVAALVGAFLWRVTGRHFDLAWRTTLAMAWATLFATVAVVLLKYACGREWPETWVEHNPSWISNHAFAFLPFHGGAGYGSFPSGHTARVTAPFAVLWHRLPRWRVLWVLPTLLVTVGLLGANFHFPSDCIAGAGLGVVCALLALRFF